MFIYLFICYLFYYWRVPNLLGWANLSGASVVVQFQTYNFPGQTVVLGQLNYTWGYLQYTSNTRMKDFKKLQLVMFNFRCQSKPFNQGVPQYENTAKSQPFIQRPQVTMISSIITMIFELFSVHDGALAYGRIILISS